MRRRAIVASGFLAVALAAVVGVGGPRGYLGGPSTDDKAGDTGAQGVHRDPVAGPFADDEDFRGFRRPSGEPASVSCVGARRIVKQARTHLAFAPSSPEWKEFAQSTADWLDPHGLWSASMDSPIKDVLLTLGKALLAELENERASSGCPSASLVGQTMVNWVAVLRKEFDDARAAAALAPPSDPASIVVFETGPAMQQAKLLAVDIGTKIGAAENLVGLDVREYGDSARKRFFPDLDAEGWGEVVLAAAVRAYIPQIDPHGAWAPLDEESSVYEVDLEAVPPMRLWDKASRSPLGLRVEENPVAPLLPGDVLLSLGTVGMGGLPLEQMDQLALAVADGKAEPSAVVFRPGEKSLLTLSLEVHPRSATPSVEEAVTTALTAERIRYGNDEVLVVGIPDVHDDLGPDLARTILAERSREGSRLAGVILDLRGNGGGSTDGAIAALGLFLPGVPLFPMKRRDGTVDTDRAPEPPLAERWTGPVATFVDGDTASAAEMIAGGLMAYNRGPSLGTQTFGKGCAQEYLDDETGYGVLRLTTLLYAMPDGRPVQRVGLSPNVYFPFVSGSASNSTKREREALLPHAPPSWRGPDVRGPGWHHRRVSLDGLSVPWPNHGGNVGPCNDSNVCRALRALGTQSVGRRSTNGRLK